MFFKLAFLIYLVVRGYCHLNVWLPRRIRDVNDTVLFVISIVAGVVLASRYHQPVLTGLAAAGFADILLVQGRELLDVVTDFCKYAVLKATNRRR